MTAVLSLVSACANPKRAGDGAAAEECLHAPADANATQSGGPVLLFDGSTLDGWSIIDDIAFPGRGSVSISEGTIRFEEGGPFTGIVLDAVFPTQDFEISLKARRIGGNDIFCGLTVPVGTEHVSLVLGGWGNCLMGLSCVDGHNASDNQTTTEMKFDNDRWYDVALRVNASRIEVWVDDECYIELDRDVHHFTVYDVLLPTRPVGLFTWRTSSEIKDAAYIRLSGE